MIESGNGQKGGTRSWRTRVDLGGWGLEEAWPAGAQLRAWGEYLDSTQGHSRCEMTDQEGGGWWGSRQRCSGRDRR